MEKILRNIEVPTGNICVMQGEKGKLEFLSIGDYGKDANIKADFLGITRELNGVPNGEIMPLEEKWVITLSTQYGCSMGCKFCLPPEIPILMNDFSTKPISQIEIGDKVICNMNPKENIKEYSKQYSTMISNEGKVTGLIKRLYNGNMYIITTYNGKTIRCTDEHPIATKYKSRLLYQQACKLKVDDEIVTRAYSQMEKTKLWTLGWCVGLMEGDGQYGVSDVKRWFVSQNDIELLYYFSEYLKYFGVKTSNVWKNGIKNHRIAVQGKQVDELNRLIGANSNDIEFKRGYIAGFWDAEGFSFKNNQSVRVCNTDNSLIVKMKKYLKDFGYSYTSVYEKKPTENTKSCYTLNIKMNRDEFISKFTPLHQKRIYLGDKNSRKFSHLEKISDIKIEQYSGYVYNIETTEHSYYASEILTHNCDVPSVGKGLNATYHDLLDQIQEALKLHPEVTKTKRLNIHFARMGEPTFNGNVLDVAACLRRNIYDLYENNSIVHPVISTMMPKNNKNLVKFLDIWCNDIKNKLYEGNAGLQFSINSTDDEQREDMFNGNSLTLKEISEIGKQLPQPKGRKYALNFALADEYIIEADKLKELFDPEKFMCKITPLHRTNSCIENGIETTGGYESFTPYQTVEAELKRVGFDVIVFVPSYDEDLGLITCGNAILSGNMPKIKYKELK